MEDYNKRINRYHRLDIKIVPELKKKENKMKKFKNKKKERQFLKC